MSAKAASSPGRKKASNMFKEAKSFSSFSVNDLKKAKEFYSQTLGLEFPKHRKGLSFTPPTTPSSYIPNQTTPRPLSPS